MKKRLLGILLACSMVLTLLPAAAFAAGDSGAAPAEQPEVNPAALNGEGETWTEVDQAYISDHKDSKNEVTLSTGAYRLTGDITLNDSGVSLLCLEGTVTLDLKGYELKRTRGSTYAVYVNENAELTLADGSAAQSGVIRAQKGTANSISLSAYLLNRMLPLL